MTAQERAYAATSWYSDALCVVDCLAQSGGVRVLSRR